MAEGNGSSSSKNSGNNNSDINSNNNSSSSCSSNRQGDMNLLEANRYMLEHQVACDVQFCVGEQQTVIPSHKYILVCRSAVFQAMFSGEFADANGVVKVPDIEPDIFRAFLTFLYTDETTVTGDNVLPLLYTAKKYNVNSLVRLCLTFLNNGRSPDNICEIMEQAHFYTEEDFMKKSVDYIVSNAREVLKSPSFMQLCRDCVSRIISLDELQADERTVLEAVSQWAENQCQKQGIDKTQGNMRDVMGDMLYLIRFPLLGETYFTNVVSESGLLTDSEKVELFKYFYKSGGEAKTFITRNRYAACAVSQHSVAVQRKPDDRSIQTCMRFTTVSEDGSWYCGGEPDAIMFSANQNLWLHGALVYGSYIGEGTYDITCSVFDPNDVELVQMRSQIKTSEHQLTYILLFETAVKLNQDRKYTLLVKATNPDGIDTYQGKDGAASVNVGSVHFTFAKSKFSRNGTDVKMGQIPGLLFSPLH